MTNITVLQLPVAPLYANCYIVTNKETAECVLVDTGGEAERIIEECEGLTPVAVLLTHGHFDHCAAADQICAHFGIPLYVHEADLPKLPDAVLNASVGFGMPVTIHAPAVPLSDGQVLKLAGIDFTVMHTPGHTEGSVCYLLPDDQGVLSGDTIMTNGYGRTDLPGGDMHQMRLSLRKLMYLSPRRRLYPGHDEMGYVGRN